jgi:hypothetical protein
MPPFRTELTLFRPNYELETIMMKRGDNRGFTLIEVAIVLVITRAACSGSTCGWRVLRPVLQAISCWNSMPSWMTAIPQQVP